LQLNTTKHIYFILSWQLVSVDWSSSSFSYKTRNKVYVLQIKFKQYGIP
jgi:hypothetical protein